MIMIIHRGTVLPTVRGQCSLSTIAGVKISPAFLRRLDDQFVVTTVICTPNRKYATYERYIYTFVLHI